MGASKKKHSRERDFAPVGELLRKARIAAGLNQREVSDALGYASSRLISKYESGMAAPPLNKLKLFVDLYKIPPTSLVDLIFECQREVVLRSIKTKIKSQA